MKTLITGAGSDLAQAFISRRRRLGDEVIATSTRSLPGTLPFDLSNPEKSEVGSVLKDGVDCLILNAAGRIQNLRRVHEVPFAEMRDYLRCNVEGNLWLIQKALPAMQAKGFGRILFISSVSAQSGTSGYGIYCAAKAAVEGLIFNLAVDYAEFGIFSNILRPGILKTSRTEGFWSRPGYQRLVEKTIPAGKLGTCTQVAEASDALLSPTSYVNGAVLEVSGGLPRIRSKGLT